jgi:hypothetical protein
MALVLPAVLVASATFGIAATLEVPGHHPTIQAAIDAASSGDVVLVAPGTYLENIDFKGKAITVKSADGPAVTLIDGGNPVDPKKASVVTFATGEGPDSVLKGFTITHGLGTELPEANTAGGGIYCKASSPTVTGNIIKANEVKGAWNAATKQQPGLGGGIYCENASPVIMNNTVSHNAATDKGYGGGISGIQSTPTLSDNIIELNVVVGKYSPSTVARGGGLYFEDSTPEIQDNSISMNTAQYGGGAGICFIDSSGVLKGNLIAINTAVSSKYGEGGGIFSQGSDIEITTGDLSENAAQAHGGGIHGIESTLTISDCTITLNSAIMEGGGIHGYDSTLDIRACQIAKNTAEDGGGICSLEYSNTEIRGNKIEGNSAHLGGGIYSTSGQVHDNIISDNSASSGGGVYSYNTLVNHNDIKGNSANTFGGGVCCFSGSITDNTITKNRASSVAGVYIDGTWGSAFIAGNTVSANRGHGIGSGWAFPIITNNTVTENNGHGISCGSFGIVEIRNNVVARNAWSGIDLSCSEATVEANLITGNALSGIDVSNMNGATLADNLIMNNSTIYRGGGIHCYSSTNIVVICNTIVGNNAEIEGGGIYCEENTLKLTNSILWNNWSASGKEIMLGLDAWLIADHSDVQGGLAQIGMVPGAIVDWGSGMIDADPFFVDPANGDYHIFHPSPCRNTGDNFAPGMGGLLKDLDGNPRISGGLVDMGCDEFHTHLYYTGAAHPGSWIDMKFIAPPGGEALLYLGSGILNPHKVTNHGIWYLEPPLITVPAGTVPAQGLILFHSRIPVTSPSPLEIPMQALAGGELSGLCTLHVN